jgi:nicotinamidase-related amidase
LGIQTEGRIVVNNQMRESLLEPFTPRNTTIMMVDYSVGFINTFRSHAVNDHLTATVALAKTALGFRSGLVVNLGTGQTPYPQLVQALGDHPIIYRGGEYNAFDSATVRKTVEATERKSIAIAGISTDGCVIETALGALRLGYRVALVEDATAGATRDTHDIAVRRMMQAGVVPVSWLSLATEFQMDWENKDTAQAYFSLIAEASPGLNMSIQAEHAAANKR